MMPNNTSLVAPSMVKDRKYSKLWLHCEQFIRTDIHKTIPLSTNTGILSMPYIYMDLLRLCSQLTKKVSS